MERRIANNASQKYITIQDPDDPRLSPYRCLKGKVLERDGIFMAEGEKIVKSMIDSGCRIASSLMWLKKHRNTRIIAAIPARGATDIAKADFSGNICLVFGNEDKGVSRGVSRICDTKVRIPISKTVDSLNVASASAVFLYEAFRQV